MESYAKLYREYFALDGYIGPKSKMETFAGADETLTFETMMPSGKALQSCTSHDLGQNFAKAFDTKFQDEDGEDKFVWQTSWGISTRSIGGLIVGHGDDNGLIVPPKLAPVQVIVVPVEVSDDLLSYCKDLVSKLKQSGVRVRLDDREDERFGFKLNKWEVKGVPIALKIGRKELEQKNVTAKRRDSGEEAKFELSTLNESVESLLDSIQLDLLSKSTKIKEENTRVADDYEQFKQILKEHKGFVKVYWNDNTDIERKIKEETMAVSRCMIEESEVEGRDFFTGEPSKTIWLFAQAY
jgi:prolyl-tRNA synthetase